MEKIQGILEKNCVPVGLIELVHTTYMEKTKKCKTRHRCMEAMGKCVEISTEMEYTKKLSKKQKKLLTRVLSRCNIVTFADKASADISPQNLENSIVQRFRKIKAKRSAHQKMYKRVSDQFKI